MIAVKEMRLSAGLTQQQLADAAGINVKQIQKIEYGEIAPGNMTAKNLIALADALGVDPHEIINGGNTMKIEKYYWTEDSFGAGPIPTNMDAIISAANAILDDYAEQHPDADEDDAQQFDNNLWERFCESDKIGDVTAIYE